MQLRHPYEYSEYGTKNGWRKEGKKLSRDWVYVWAVKNPKTGKVALVMSNNDSDAPTRVEPIETWYNAEILRRIDGTDERVNSLDDGMKWRAFCAMVDSGRILLAEKNQGAVASDYLEALVAREIEENADNY